MRLERVRASASPLGYTVRLSWEYADPPTPGDKVRVVRGDRSYPVDVDDGVLVTEVGAPGSTFAEDHDLPEGRTCYYRLFPYSPSRGFVLDPPYQVNATPTGRYDVAGFALGLLPSVYRRCDPDGVFDALLGPAGEQLDELYSLIRRTATLHDIDQVEPALLPLLARWIGWQPDQRSSVTRTRAEIGFAPRLYRVGGTRASLDAAVRRVLGHPTPIKEFAASVATTNRPPRMSLWQTVLATNGSWQAPSPVSPTGDTGGGQAWVRLPDGDDLVILTTGCAGVRRLWAMRGRPGPDHQAPEWQPADLLDDRPGTHARPSAAVQPTTGGHRLWVFWEVLEPATADRAPRRRIAALARDADADGAWSEPELPFVADGHANADDAAERLNPTVTVDASGGLWLFWREHAPEGWVVRYNRHSGTGWQLTPSAVLDQLAARNDDPTVPPPVADLVVTAAGGPGDHPTLWLFWSGPVTAGGHRLGFCAKHSPDPAEHDWSDRLGGPATTNASDREPAPRPLAGGVVEAVWATTRGVGASSPGGWALARSVFGPGPPWSWEPVDVTAAEPYYRRAPVLAGTTADGDLRILFRWDRSPGLPGLPGLLGLPGLPDPEAAGSLTARPADLSRRAIAGTLTDRQTYTPQCGHHGVRTPDDRIGCDTVGVFVPDGPGTSPADLGRLTRMLEEVVPAGVRVVPVVDPTLRDHEGNHDG
jgi:phage tail-like protein